jgi:hypothetical protein
MDSGSIGIPVIPLLAEARLAVPQKHPYAATQTKVITRSLMALQDYLSVPLHINPTKITLRQHPEDRRITMPSLRPHALMEPCRTKRSPYPMQRANVSDI